MNMRRPDAFIFDLDGTLFNRGYRLFVASNGLEAYVKGVMKDILR